MGSGTSGSSRSCGCAGSGRGVGKAVEDGSGQGGYCRSSSGGRNVGGGTRANGSSDWARLDVDAAEVPVFDAGLVHDTEDTNVEIRRVLCQQSGASSGIWDISKNQDM
jgi:hypothetical protein